ncbi:MAG: hypothetical protein ABSH47_19025, partial [Bryobacteraceae bacterium]
SAIHQLIADPTGFAPGLLKHFNDFLFLRPTALKKLSAIGLKACPTSNRRGLRRFSGVVVQSTRRVSKSRNQGSSVNQRPIFRTVDRR